MGAKARSLERLRREGFPVPPFFVVAPDEALDAGAIARRCARLAPAESDPSFAARSSAQAEDGAEASYAGMFESFLFVSASDVCDKIERVRASGSSTRVATYSAQRGDARRETPSAIVQLMVDADVAGVAFGRDPVDGSDRVVIASAYGLGSGIVGGDCDTDTYRVACDGSIVDRLIARKTLAHGRAMTVEGTSCRNIEPEAIDTPSLTDTQALHIARTVRDIGARFGQPQDVEWAIAGGRLHILQARPVTTPAGIIWDNSNISESYGGLVSPLTFSFTRYAYAGAYRQLMRIFAIPTRTIEAHAEALDNMLGLVSGRMYYNLLNWYRLLALVPGFRLNRRFMESMMGVSEPLPDGVVRELERHGKGRELLAVIVMLAAIVRRYVTLRRDVRLFHRLIERALSQSPRLETLNLAELDTEYRRLETCLLTNWEAPLVNDFFAMVFYGLLRNLSDAWCAGTGGSIHNDLLCAHGDMISTEPARLIIELAGLIRSDDRLLEVLSDGDAAHAEAEIARNTEVRAAYATYLERFGDRCQSELKLESLTLHDDPLPLLRGIARMARAETSEDQSARTARTIRDNAEKQIAAALSRRPLRRTIFRFVLAQARERLTGRENLRFERTRVFGRVRVIFTEMGRRLHAPGALSDPRDVFWLEVDEVRNAVNPAARGDLRARVSERRATYAAYAAAAAPPDRFTALSNDAPISSGAPAGSDAVRRTGIGCCPGAVRARVRIIRDPQTPIEPGEILVAERTDPGWIVLFPAAAGILVEHGSVLSHAAIVSREMGIPSIVGIAGLTAWLHDGDVVEFDGRAGTVTRLQEVAVP